MVVAGRVRRIELSRTVDRMVLELGFEALWSVDLRYGLGFGRRSRGGYIEIIQLKLRVQSFVICNLTGREKSGGDGGFFYNGVSQFTPLSAPCLLPGANARIRFQAYHSSNRILSELAPMGCRMLVLLEERGFCSTA